MYILMFLAAIRLRTAHPNVKRSYRVPLLKTISCLGISGPLFVLTLGFFPPSQLEVGSFFIYEAILLGGGLLFCLIPLLIYYLRKPSWKM
jgi:amino acid transporter